MRWSGEFGGLIGKSEEQVRRYFLERESDLRMLGGKEDVYREHIVAVAEPLLIAAAGSAMDIAPLHDFIGSMVFESNGPNPNEVDALQWLQRLRYQLLHQEKLSKSWTQRAIGAIWTQWWKFFAGILATVITGIVLNYFRSRGINLK